MAERRRAEGSARRDRDQPRAHDLDDRELQLEQFAAGRLAPGDHIAVEREVVTRVSTSGGRHWGINVGRYRSRYQAERVLLKTALNEMETLDGSLRRVTQSKKGFDANFMGLTRDDAEMACRRLQARNVTCFMIGPS